MTITLPDIPDAAQLGPAEVRLELGCALYARGRLGKIGAAELAGVDFFTFQRALEERGIPLYTEKMLADDLQTLGTLFPK
jgi:predicted HTH domain antitoxin